MSIQATINAEIKKLILKRRDTTIKRLISAHQSGGLNDGNMRGIVGELAGLHFLLVDAEDLVKRERRGEQENG